MECIICRTEQDQSEMSDEHVIPDSLGGYYHIYNVCRPCNSKMGETVDSPLINNKITELYRFCEQLQGKSGNIPNPFTGTIIGADDPAVKARAIVGEDGVLRFVLLPRVHVNEEDGVVKSIEISVDVEDEAKIEPILQKKLARLGVDSSGGIQGERVRSVLEGGFSTRWEIDARNFKIGLLKIAYEFAVDSIESFYDTDEAREIARILHETNYEAVEGFVKIGSGLQPEVFDPFTDYLDVNSRKHYLVLIQTDMGLVCCIKLHSLFCVGIVLSTQRLLVGHEAIFGINDIVQRSFRKLDMNELVAECLGPTHIRLGYFFATEAEAALASGDVNSPTFRYQSDANGDPKLYSAIGVLDRRPLSDVLDHSTCSDYREGGWFVSLYEIDATEELFVRSVSTDKLYRLSALEISREFVKKV